MPARNLCTGAWRQMKTKQDCLGRAAGNLGVIMGTQCIDVIPGQSAKSQACFPDFIPQKPAAPLCFLKLSIFAVHHKASLLSELTHKNQPVQYASSILNLQVVLTHPQVLNRRDEWHSRRGGGGAVSGHPAGLPAAATRKTNAFASKQTSKDKGRKARQDSSPS